MVIIAPLGILQTCRICYLHACVLHVYHRAEPVLISYILLAGKNGVDAIRSHPWFDGLDWDTLRDQPAPYTPDGALPVCL